MFKRYPIDFDNNIRQQTENCSNSEERKRIREFASMTAIGFKHQVKLYQIASFFKCLVFSHYQIGVHLQFV